MFKYLLTCMALVHVVWAKPAFEPQQQHILILTPQAQVQLDPSLKYDSPAAFIHHLAPFARIAAPHEETIVYVPANVAVRSADGSETKQFPDIPSAIQEAGQEGANQISNQAGTQVGQICTLFNPSPSPSPSPSQSPSSGSSLKDIAGEGRRSYAIGPVVPHVVDVVHQRVISARSLPQEAAEESLKREDLKTEREPAVAAATNIIAEEQPQGLATDEREAAPAQLKSVFVGDDVHQAPVVGVVDGGVVGLDPIAVSPVAAGQQSQPKVVAAV